MNVCAITCSIFPFFNIQIHSRVSINCGFFLVHHVFYYYNFALLFKIILIKMQEIYNKFTHLSSSLNHIGIYVYATTTYFVCPNFVNHDNPDNIKDDTGLIPLHFLVGIVFITLSYFTVNTQATSQSIIFPNLNVILLTFYIFIR